MKAEIKKLHEFAPFELILRFESKDDIGTFGQILFDALGQATKISDLTEPRPEEIEMINYIEDIMTSQSEK